MGGDERTLGAITERQAKLDELAAAVGEAYPHLPEGVGRRLSCAYSAIYVEVTMQSMTDASHWFAEKEAD